MLYKRVSYANVFVLTRGILAQTGLTMASTDTPSTGSAVAAPKTLEPLNPGALGISCTIGGLFMGLALVDYSVAVHESATELLPLYLQWKHAAPIISPMMLFFALFLPLESIRAVREDVLGLVRRPAGFARHAVGTAAFALMMGVVTCVVVTVMPAEQAAVAAGKDMTLQQLETLQGWYLLMLLLNILTLVLGIAKYAVSQPTPSAPPKTKDE